jgi:hypothetical protein
MNFIGFGTHSLGNVLINADLLPRWLPVHKLLDVEYGEKDTTLPRMLSSRPLILVTASNGSLHARKQLIDKISMW